ncbi:MAG TPA: beta-propeller domain-containing protein [Solirubrobacteraceae bacterium]|nr:beta-propeller domain-containing protein [Solirubrobacteraceae bacterium]
MIASAQRIPSSLRASLVALTAFAVLAAGLVAPVSAPAASKRLVKPSALPAFPSCASLLSYARRNARRTGGRTGVPTRAGVLQAQVLEGPVQNDAVAVPGTPAPAAQAAPSAPGAASPSPGRATPEFSQTNVQEAGVDEPDIVKTNGRTVFAVADAKLHAIDVSGDAPRLVGTLALDGAYGHQLLLRGDRLLVMSNSYGGVPLASGVIISASQVVISELDVSDPAAMNVRRTMTMEGALVDARMTGGTARVVVSASPSAIRPAAVGRASLRTFVPRTVLRSRLSGKTFRRSMVACDDVRHPRRFSGLDLLTVLTIDLDKGLFNVDRDAIMAGAQTVYASATGLYVASQRYVRALEAGRTVPERSRTDIHRFDISKPDATSFASSGSVTGFVLNQYSMSEHDGALRVASTEQPVWFEGRADGDSESFVTVLAEHGRSLDLVGRVGGLGRGEQIYAVRFVGDKGYVVTFRQVDPLYTLDLSKKTDPRVVGELKILGYSAYLHPISDDLLLGVGQDASAQGRTLGTQLSLFDVSNPRLPARRANVSLGGGASSSAEFDPHAFLFWDPSNLAVIPLTSFSEQTRFSGAVGFRIGSTAIAEVGRVVHPAGPGEGGYTPEIGRSLVIGDALYTLSYAGLAANRLDNLASLSFTPFPHEPRAVSPGPLSPPQPVP